MNVLVLNSGSSSVKYKLFDMDLAEVLAEGVLERIGEAASRLTQRWKGGGEAFRERICDQPVTDHRQALGLIVDIMRETGVLEHPDRLHCIGHRVVHGGEHFREPALITAGVMAAIRDMIPLAPLHNPANLAGIEVALEFAPRVAQVAVFDTAFHQTIPRHAFLYALPYEHYERLHVRRYGFHGISHGYVTRETARLLGRHVDEISLVSLHLGNGASITAVRNGASIDTSMGMTPLEGLIMGTRCGDIDPSIPFYLEKTAGLGSAEVESILNHDSGLKGICGVSDMREIQQLAGAGDDRARLAFDMFCYRIRKYLGSCLALLDQTDAVVFTGGIGENSAQVRAQCCKALAPLGIRLDDAKNTAPLERAAEIQQDGSAARILVIRSDEELEIARQSVATVSAVAGS